MRRPSFIPAATLLAFVAFAAAAAAGQEAPPGASKAASPETPAVAARAFKAEDFAWLAGTWKGQLEGGVIEEVWLPPTPGEKGTMLGMFRWMRGDVVAVYELLAIEPASDPGAAGLVLTLRHFGPGLVGWEDKTEPLTFHLVSVTPTEATFDNRDPGRSTRILYKKEGADGLLGVLERSRDGRLSRDEFRYTRVR